MVAQRWSAWLIGLLGLTAALALGRHGAAGQPPAATSEAAAIPDVLSHILAEPRPAPDVLSFFWATHAGRRLTIDPDGTVSVLDEGGHRVVAFGADGSYRGQWGGFGYEEGRLALPLGLVRAPDGTLYVTDHFHPHDGGRTPARMQRFDARGRYLGDWWWPSGSPENLRLDAIGPDGSLYAVDVREPAIHRYAPDGRRLASWNRAGPAAEPFAGHVSLAVAPDGRVWVADYRGAKVHVFSAAGEHITSWGELGEGPGQLHHLFVIALGPDGSVYLASLGSMNDQVQRFSADGRFLAAIGEAKSNFDGGVADMAVSPDGTLNVFRQVDGVIERYSPTGELLATWGHLPEPAIQGGGLFDVGGDGTLWRFDGARLLRFDLLGNRQGSVDVPEIAELADGYWLPTMAASPDGSVYLAADNPNEDRLIHLAGDGRLLAHWPVELQTYELYPSLATAADGSVYLASPGDHRVQHWDGQGRKLGEWGGTGRGDGQFTGEVLLGVAADGTVHALDRDPWANPDGGGPLPPDRMQRFSPAGALLGQWLLADAAASVYTVYGSAHDLAVGADGTSYIPTSGLLGWDPRAAILALSPEGRLLQSFLPPIPSVYAGTGTSYTRLEAGPGDSLVVSDARGLAVLRPDYSPAWVAAYYPDTTWSAWPTVVTLPTLDLSWGASPPQPGLPADGFAANFERVIPSDGGAYRFHVRADGGVRLWVGPRLLVDRWHDAAVDEAHELPLAAGPVRIVLEFTDPGGPAGVALDWGQLRPTVGRLALPLVWRNWPPSF